MGDEKSLKYNLGNLLKSTTSTFTDILHNLSSHSAAFLNASDADSASLTSIAQKPNFEGITLIWYDPQISKTEDTKLTSEELREINDCVIQYSDQVECINYIQSVENEKIFLVTSGKGAISILPEIDQMRQIDSIFIFCFKVEKYQHLLETYDTIVGIYSKRSDLIDSIKQNVDLLQKQLNTFSFYNEHEEKATRDISKESAEFLWFQLFKDLLLRMPRNDKAKQELIDFSYQYYRGNKKEHENITEFAKSYKLDKSIYWYTKDSFLYRLVNKALRTEDIGQLHIFRFFISDLSSKLDEIHTKKHRGQKTTIMFYRGLKMEIDELNKLKQNQGSIISANGFLSTSHSKDVAIEFARRSTKRKNIIPVLYEIECNLHTLKSIVFADITKYSKFAQEQEVLFDLGSTFQIESINENEELQMVLVKLIATDAGMEMAQKYIQLNRKMNEETTSDILFGILLIQMGKYDQSLNYFVNLLNESNEKIDRPRIYNEIGSAYLWKGELDKAFEHADHAYQMMIKVKPPRIKDSSRPMTIMAHVYFRREMYEKSLDFYLEVLEIREKFCGSKHLDTAVALNHIGNVYYKMEDYSKALIYYQKAFEIQKKQLPNVHLDIAASFNNLGLIQWKMNKLYEALNYYQQSLDIRRQLLPSNHDDIIQSLHNITRVLYEDNKIDESLKYFTEVLTIQKIAFDPNDRNNLSSRLQEKFGPRKDNIGVKLTQPEQLLECAFIREIKLHAPMDYHIKLENFIKTVKNDDDYGMALEALKQILMSHTENSMCRDAYTKDLMEHLQDLVRDAYDSTDDSIEALQFYEKVQSILKSTISNWVDTNDVQIICLERIGYIHQINGNYESAVESLEKSLNIQRDNNKSYEVTPDKLRCIGLIHMTLGNYKSALILFNDALKLLQQNFAHNDREIKLLLKRIEQATEGLKSITDLSE